MIDKLLIANRGEIACRVIRTAHRMGIATVAVHSDADAGAMHVRMADEAVRIGPASAAQSYLDSQAVLEAVRTTGADAVHPGYGFLSENEDFARACEAAGVHFVGPPAEAIRAMGSKRAALVLMAGHGIPVLPGYRGEAQDDDSLLGAADEVGYPVILKPSAGGGGKGMQVARSRDELADVLEATRRVARAAFGDDTLLIERYLERPRHVEIQVFADAHGNAVHLFERDCSVQRRHQKVVEEAPAPDFGEAVRASMGEAAVNAARAIGYRGAGTVEFLYDDASEHFHFMEMNTRLQVEHPVTEMITGVDLVEWQLRVAAGEPLPLEQAAIPRNGHAIEVRLYAEDPARDFLPATGPVEWFTHPEHARVDAGVAAGDEVGVHYDPMIAKLIVHGADRAQALARLQRALAGTRIGPLTSNLSFLRALAGHATWQAGAVDTNFLAREAGALSAPAMDPDDALCAAAAWIASAPRAAPGSPWDLLRGLRLNLPSCERTRFELAGEPVDVVLERGAGEPSLTLTFADVTRSIERASRNGPKLTLRMDGHERDVSVHGSGARLFLDDGHAGAILTRLETATAAEASLGQGAGALTAPMPGRVVAVNVSAGDRVEAGQALLVLEAMKMEHTLSAPAAGTVETLSCDEGMQVDEGAVLIALDLEGSD